jgi:type III secretory pathway component EscT
MRLWRHTTRHVLLVLRVLWMLRVLGVLLILPRLEMRALRGSLYLCR